MNKDLLSSNSIENRIFTIRGLQVMFDRDLAELYQTETKYVNRAVKRNSDRFPINFLFQLDESEWTIFQNQFEKSNLKFQSGTTSGHGGRRNLPNVFTEQGVAMLSAVLQSPIAIQVSIQIINAFVNMRKSIAIHSGLFQRIDGIERKILESDQKFDKIFKALESKDQIPSQGIFFDGQVFDAYELASRIIRSAKTSIILIDNYINESTLTHLAKKKRGVKSILLTKSISKQLELDIQKANEQYGDFEVKPFDKSHDRFLIIDSQEIYHLGASLKDLGKKWFAFSKIEESSVKILIELIPT